MSLKLISCLVTLPLLIITSCSEPLIQPSRNLPVAYVDGFVDAERGVLISLRQPIPPDVGYDLDSLDEYALSGVEVRVCSVPNGACVAIPQVDPGFWRLESLPTGLGSVVSLEVELDGNVYRVDGRFPPEDAIKYDSIATTFIPEARDVRDIYEDALAHDFKVAAASDSFTLVVAWPEIGARVSAGVYPTGGSSECGIFDFTQGYHIITPTCNLSAEIELSAYQFAEASDTVHFALAATYDRDYVLFLEALRQDNYDSEFGGLYDVLEVEGNIPGLSGYVLFSRSLDVLTTL